MCIRDSTPVAPAPMPAARTAVKIRRRIRPLAVDAICLLLSPGKHRGRIWAPAEASLSTDSEKRGPAECPPGQPGAATARPGRLLGACASVTKPPHQRAWPPALRAGGCPWVAPGGLG